MYRNVDEYEYVYKCCYGKKRPAQTRFVRGCFDWVPQTGFCNRRVKVVGGGLA